MFAASDAAKPTEGESGAAPSRRFDGDGAPPLLLHALSTARVEADREPWLGVRPGVRARPGVGLRLGSPPEGFELPVRVLACVSCSL